MIGSLNLSSGSSKINGIIEEYKVASGGNVNAGDFVRFVENRGEATEIHYNETKQGQYNVSAVALDDNKVFIVYGLETKYDKGERLIGALYKIDGTIIERISEIILDEYYVLYKFISVAALNSNKFFIVYSKVNNSSYSIEAIVCEITGNSISKGIATIVDASLKEMENISAVTLDNNKVFIAYGGKVTSSNHPLCSNVCSIDEKTITVGTRTKLNTFTSNNPISLVALDNNRVFATYRSTIDNNNCLCGTIYTIVDNSITIGTEVQLNLGYINSISLILLENNTVFIAYGMGSDISSTVSLYGMICEIGENTNTISIKMNTQLETKIKYLFVISIMQININKLLIGIRGNNGTSESTGYTSDICHYGLLCEITSEAIIVKLFTQLNIESSPNKGAMITLDGNKIFTAYSSGANYYHLKGIVNVVGTIEKVSELQDNIVGIAKTKGTAGQTIKVIVPN